MIVKTNKLAVFALIAVTFSASSAQDTQKESQDEMAIPPARIHSRTETESALRNYFNFGLTTKDQSALVANGASSSFADVFGWSIPHDVSELLKLSTSQRKALERILNERKNARDLAIQNLQVDLVFNREIDDKVFNQAVEKLRRAESVAEKELLAALDELLLPEQARTLERLAISKCRVKLGELEYTSRALDLDQNQRRAFSGIESMIKEIVFRRLSEGHKEPGNLSDDPAIGKKLLAAENLLSTDQFLHYARAIGMVTEKETLDDHYAKQRTDERKKLVEAYKVFRQIEKNRLNRPEP